MSETTSYRVLCGGRHNDTILYLHPIQKEDPNVNDFTVSGWNETKGGPPELKFHQRGDPMNAIRVAFVDQKLVIRDMAAPGEMFSREYVDAYGVDLFEYARELALEVYRTAIGGTGHIYNLTNTDIDIRASVWRSEEDDGRRVNVIHEPKDDGLSYLGRVGGLCRRMERDLAITAARIHKVLRRTPTP